MKSFNLIVWAALLGWTTSTLALKESVYVGEAKHKGKLVYREFHYLKHDSKGKLLSARTEYKNPEGKILSTLDSDFTTNLTAPAHLQIDNISETQYGIRYVNNQLTMFNQEKNKSEKTKIVQNSSNEGVLVGCQGLNYFVLENFDLIKSKKKLTISFLIPGNLDSFNFDLKLVKEYENGEIDLELSIHSFWLKLFAPKLFVKYDRNKQRLLYYKGLSNIRDENGNFQDVEIEYKYDT